MLKPTGREFMDNCEYKYVIVQTTLWPPKNYSELIVQNVLQRHFAQGKQNEPSFSDVTWIKK